MKQRIVAMMSDRELVLETVQNMPEHVSLDDILSEIQLVATLKRRLHSIEEGHASGVPADKVGGMIQQWITK